MSSPDEIMVPDTAAEFISRNQQTATIVPADQLIEPVFEDDGFELIEDKSRLVNVPFVIVDWIGRDGENGAYVSLRCIGLPAAGSDLSDKHFVFNDGAQYGVSGQLLKLEEKWSVSSHGEAVRPTDHGTIMVCNKGLAENTYTNKAGIKVKGYRIAV